MEEAKEESIMRTVSLLFTSCRSVLHLKNGSFPHILARILFFSEELFKWDIFPTFLS